MKSDTISTSDQLLVIDSNPSYLAFLDTSSNGGRFNVKVATNRTLAIKMLEEDLCDIILINSQLEHMNGLEILQKIRQNPTTTDTPVLMIIDRFDDQVTSPLTKQGADDFITMPLNANELQHRITSLLKIKSQATQIRESNHKLEQLMAVRKKLFSTISHDLRTPIGALEVLMELLRSSIERNNEAQTQKLLNMMDSTIESGHKLFENLILWGRSQTNRLRVDLIELHIASLTEEVMEMIAPLAKGKNIQIINDIDDELMGFADAEILKTILKNLLVNAIKYCEPLEGKVEINSSKDDHNIYLSVKDNGTGIEASIIHQLFSPEGNITSQHGTSNEEGTGLGLILCQEYAIKLGGKISVKSTPGNGSTFTLQIPVFKITEFSAQERNQALK